MEENLLDVLLSEVVKVVDPDKKQSTSKNYVLKESDLFSKDSNVAPATSEQKGINSKKGLSLIHSGDTDSSDDEDNKYYEEQNYNESGRKIKHLLESKTSTSGSSQQSPASSATWSMKPKREELVAKAKASIIKQDVHTDPVFGLRIINPLVSFTTLKDRMVGREAIPFSRLKKFVSGNISDKNWVVAGVVVNKSVTKTSQKGNKFLIWTLSDLKDDIKTTSLFLFGSAYKELWKTTVGTIVGVLNASVFEKKDGFKDEASLSVDNAQKVMILGQSKDFGTCKSVKKNGDPCTAIVNINRCEYCVYHIKQEYQKCSRRSELQSNFSGKGLAALKKQFLANNGIPYIAAKRNSKLDQKDRGRLQALDNKSVIGLKPSKVKNLARKSATNLEVSQKQRLKDLALLDRLGENEVKTDFNASLSSEVTLESSKITAISVISKLKASTGSNISEQPQSNVNEANINKILPNFTMNVPMLTGTGKGTVDLSVSTTPSQISRAKLNAIKYIQKNGALTKNDPNNIKSSTTNKKRALEALENEENDPKKPKLVENEFLSDRFKKMMQATSKHMDLLDHRDEEERDKYFYKLEMKEKMEDKMINTYKMPCKAVRCLKCKYTNFSASQLCKDEKHPLRVFDAMKRFFKCGNCQNRTVSLEIVPTRACKSCGGSKWERTGMMKDKMVTATPTLSIRGGEQIFINSGISNGNLDLLIPDT